jgi:hypothetical protein
MGVEGGVAFRTTYHVHPFLGADDGRLLEHLLTAQVLLPKVPLLLKIFIIQFVGKTGIVVRQELLKVNKL